MLTVIDKKKLHDQLNQCTTLDQMLKVITTQYDATQCKPGFITKPRIIDGLIEAVNILNPPKKM